MDLSESTYETARLILMEMREYGDESITSFRNKMREAGEPLFTMEVVALWKAYMGWDGRISPTHSIDTGLRL